MHSRCKNVHAQTLWSEDTGELHPPPDGSWAELHFLAGEITNTTMPEVPTLTKALWQNVRAKEFHESTSKEKWVATSQQQPQLEKTMTGWQLLLKRQKDPPRRNREAIESPKKDKPEASKKEFGPAPTCRLSTAAVDTTRHQSKRCDGKKPSLSSFDSHEMFCKRPHPDASLDASFR